MKSIFLKRNLKNYLQGIKGFFLPALSSHSGPIVFKPITFKIPSHFTFHPPQDHFHPFPENHMDNPKLKNHLGKNPKKIMLKKPVLTMRKCLECLAKLPLELDPNDPSTKAQCYEFMTSACPKTAAGEKYDQCKLALNPPAESVPEFPLTSIGVK